MSVLRRPTPNCNNCIGEMLTMLIRNLLGTSERFPVNLTQGRYRYESQALQQRADHWHTQSHEAGTKVADLAQ